jgi:hypothetical protein
MWAMCGWFSEARVCASRWKRARRSGSLANEWQDLQRDVAIQRRIAGPIHFAHAAFADLGSDFVDAETRAGS